MKISHNRTSVPNHNTGGPLHVSPGQRLPAFTIVELLIVIVVIGILAAVTAVAYTRVQERAREAVMRSDLSNFAKLAEMHYVNNGRYPGANVPDLDRLNFKASKTAYPSSLEWNLDYCTNGPAGQHTQYILYVHASADRLKGLYVSSNNSSPNEIIHESYESGDGSPCYSAHPSSAAIDAGLTDIASGITGLRPAGWGAWTE